MAYEYETIHCEVYSPIGRISLNQPEKRNMLFYKRLCQIAEAAKEMERDENVRVIIIKGEGPCFSSGYDMTPGKEGKGTLWPETGFYIHPDRDWLWGSYNRQHMDVYFTLWDLQKPVIAQIHSWCLAGASELASFCDLRILADDAKIGWPVARDLSPGNIQYMPWMVGITKAKEYMFTGEPMDAQEALRSGWATRVYPRDRLEEETEKLAQNIAGIPTDLIMFTKRSINAQFEVMGFKNGLMWGSEILSLQNFRKSAGEFEKSAKKMGVKAAFKRRDIMRDR
jgi:enoyl-CoA hydratase